MEESQRKLLLFGAAAIIIILAIFAAGFVSNLPSSPSQGSTAYLANIRLTDPPQVPAGTTSLIMNYSSVAVHTLNAGWVYSNASGSVNLMELVNFSQTIANVNIPANSTIDMVRFNTTAVSMVLNGTTYNVTTPGSSILAKLGMATGVNTSTSLLVDLSPTIVSIFTVTNPVFVMVPSVKAIVVANKTVNSTSIQLGNKERLQEHERVQLRDNVANVTLSAISLSSQGNHTTFSITVTDNSNRSIIIKHISILGNESVSINNTAFTQASNEFLNEAVQNLRDSLNESSSATNESSSMNNTEQNIEHPEVNSTSNTTMESNSMESNSTESNSTLESNGIISNSSTNNTEATNSSETHNSMNVSSSQASNSSETSNTAMTTNTLNNTNQSNNSSATGNTLATNAMRSIKFDGEDTSSGIGPVARVTNSEMSDSKGYSSEDVQALANHFMNTEGMNFSERSNFSNLGLQLNASSNRTQLENEVRAQLSANIASNKEKFKLLQTHSRMIVFQVTNSTQLQLPMDTSEFEGNDGFTISAGQSATFTFDAPITLGNQKMLVSFIAGQNYNIIVSGEDTVKASANVTAS